VCGQHAELLLLTGIPDDDLAAEVAGDEAVALGVEVRGGDRRFMPAGEAACGAAVLQEGQLDGAALGLGEQAPVGTGVLLRERLRRAAARGEQRDRDRQRPQASSTGRPDLAEA
jgi:hypothetical protein